MADHYHITHLAKKWPGKSRPQIHPALWHMLDVGAVAHRMLQIQPIASEQVDQALALLAALHDIGKISASFRDMLLCGKTQKWLHWQHTAILLRHHDDLLSEILAGTDSIRKIFYESVAGHHGGPRRSVSRDYLIQQQVREIGTDALDDSRKAIMEIARLFPKASIRGLSENDAISLSWQTNGLVVLCDWIGSNTDWFPPYQPDCLIEEYWQRSQRLAEVAIDRAGLIPSMPALDGSSKILLPEFLPRPMQKAVADCNLPDGPLMCVIEDVTGSGKTEASLILAARLMKAGKADGLYFALPTMATANAMLDRMESTASVLFDGIPTFGLAHGRAHLSETFRNIMGRDCSNPESGPHCGTWLSDDRRRILFCDVGVGTIDQALFAVLPTRFNALRLRGLQRKVLIVDEAHSYDPYMEAQLRRLLTFHSRLGGSAIVMTATLPQNMKDRYTKAFQQGLSSIRPTRGSRRSHAVDVEYKTVEKPYPALTVIGNAKDLTRVDPEATAIRKVVVNRLVCTSDAVNLIALSARQGAACVWVRNAVDDAIAAFKSLQSEGIKAELLHARFAICDRLKKERRLQKRFGRNGTGRRGNVLIATQVVEQSLDLDFDVMVSDLAPIGALIQRAGRLWRHMGDHPAAKRPVETGPNLHVLSPDPDLVTDRNWLKQVLDKGAYVYPVPVMWRSAKALFDCGYLLEPDGLCELIEKVEGVDPLQLPSPLEGMGFEHEGQQIVERQLAENCLVSANKPYDQENMRKVWDDEQFPTRLGVPQVTLALARVESNSLIPYSGDQDYGWFSSELQVSKVKFEELQAPDQDNERVKQAKQNWTEARKKFTLIAPMGKNGWICNGLYYNQTLGAVWE